METDHMITNNIRNDCGELEECVQEIGVKMTFISEDRIMAESCVNRMKGRIEYDKNPTVNMFSGAMKKIRLHDARIDVCVRMEEVKTNAECVFSSLYELFYSVSASYWELRAKMVTLFLYSHFFLC